MHEDGSFQYSLSLDERDEGIFLELADKASGSVLVSVKEVPDLSAFKQFYPEVYGIEWYGRN